MRDFGRIARRLAIESLEPRAYLSGASFGSPVILLAAAAGLQPTNIDLIDLNGDGLSDLIVANGTNSVSVLPGNGDGSFGSAVTIPVQSTPIALASGFFTTSGNIDVVSGSIGAFGAAGQISIIPGNGDGTFGVAQNIPALNNNHAIAVGNFVNGGPLDVITTSNDGSNANNAGIIIGNDTGGAAVPMIPFSLPHGNVSDVVVGDFNVDGNADFAVSNQGNSSISVFLGNGDGTFQTPADYPTGPSPLSMVTGDFNSDGLLDIISADSTSGQLSFLAGNADGTFDAPVSSSVDGTVGTGGPTRLSVGDFNDDNIPDVATLLSSNSTGEATVLLNNGDGTFGNETIINTRGGIRNSIAVGDLNGDGPADVVVANSSQISAVVNGGAIITPPAPQPPTGDFSVSAPAGKILPSVVVNTTQKGKIAVTVTNNTANPITGTLTVTLYTSATQIVDDTATPLTFITKTVKNLKGGKGFVSHFKPFVYASAGTAYLVSDVQLNGTADSTDGATATPITVEPVIIDGNAVSATPTKLKIVASKKTAVTLLLQNAGNTAYNGPATVDVFLSASGILDGSETQIATAVPIKINLKPGKSKKVRVAFVPSTLPTVGSYHLVLRLMVPSDTNAANDLIASVQTITI